MAAAASQALMVFGYYVTFPYAPPAGQAGSTAIHLSDISFSAWADGYTNVQYGADVASEWQTPAKALGQAQGTAGDIVCLGRGGQITLTFSQGIANGDGFDFAVFENGISDTFLELGWVEVSSDGTHFVRFPNYSLTASPVGSFGTVDARMLFGLAGKYRLGYGTPFDLQELQTAYDDILAADTDFDALANVQFAEQLTNNFPLLDLNDIRYVRIVDAVGDGTSSFDSRGWPIYDPYPTTGSAGFDLDAIGVIHQPALEGLAQTIAFDPVPHQMLGFGSVVLDAVASSGLPVSYAVQSGPATVSGNTIFFTGTGTVEVVANQAGDATYAAAAPVLRSFEVAEQIQHVFVEPVPNQLQGGGSVQLAAYSSSGLPVKLQIFSGPASVLVDENTHLLNLGTETGWVTLHAFQPGDATTAPAKDVYMDFQIVQGSASNAPLPFADWLGTNVVPGMAVQISEDVYGRTAVVLDFDLDVRASAWCRLLQSANLGGIWTNAVPEIINQQITGNQHHLQLQVPVGASNVFYRLEFEEL